MSARSTLWLLCVTLGLLAFVIFIERPYHERREQEKSQRLLPSLTSGQVSNVEIFGGTNLHIKVERGPAGWQMTEPLPCPAATPVIEGFLATLEKLDFLHHITAQELSSRTNLQEEFGFKSPAFTIKLKGPQVDLRVEISSNPIAPDQVFLQIAGGNGIFVLPSGALRYLPSQASQWRSPEVFSLDSRRAPDILVKTAANSFHLQKTNNYWRMTAPLECRANDSKVETLLEDLMKVKIEAFVTDDPKADLEAFGLLTTGFELQLRRGTNSLGSIVAGNSPTNYPGLLYLRRVGIPGVVLVKKDIINLWKISHSEFRDKHLLSADKEFPERLSGQGEDDFEFISSSRANWVMKSPLEGKGDSFYVERLLSLLSTNDVELEKSVVTDFAPYGLDKPALRYRFGSNSPSGSNYFLNIDFGTNSAGKVFARRSDESFVSQFPAEKFSYLPRASWQFLNHKPWSFQPKDVKSITVYQQNRIRKLVKLKEGEFVIAPGSQGFINPFSVEEAVFRIGSLEIPVWEARGEASRAAYGFERQQHRLVFEFFQPGRPDVSLDIGVTSPLQIHGGAIIEGAYMIFEMPIKLYYEFISNDLIVPADPLKTQ